MKGASDFHRFVQGSDGRQGVEVEEVRILLVCMLLGHSFVGTQCATRDVTLNSKIRTEEAILTW